MTIPKKYTPFILTALVFAVLAIGACLYGLGRVSDFMWGNNNIQKPTAIDYCSQYPKIGEDAYQGIIIHPTNQKYIKEGMDNWLGRVFTEDDCGGKKMNEIFGVKDGKYWPGLVIVLDDRHSKDLLYTLKEIGFIPETICSNILEEDCNDWRLEKQVPVDDIIKLKKYIGQFTVFSCVNCG